VRIGQPRPGVYVRLAPPGATHRWRLRLAAGVAAGGLAAVALVRLGATPEGVLAAGVLAVLVVLASIDLQARVLPNVIVVPGTAAVLAWQVAFCPSKAGEWLLAALGAGLFVLLPALMRPGAMGMGDVKLAVLLGAALGRDVLIALTIGFAALLPVALWLLIRGRGVRNATVPLGPFLALGAAVVLLG
jgi:leader peptidase (prepilin peptidase) / N-methyltransferase